ncbi:MAG: hypothetical protein H6Q13_329 [Bacteroidetes bacterium]|jgi:hypothetical protein|nr:hypothetical protein [Bacteroidota bacterium]
MSVEKVLAQLRRSTLKIKRLKNESIYYKNIANAQIQGDQEAI